MPKVDLSFDLYGTTIPLDHGYLLFSALCGVIPQLHGDTRIGIHPIRGRQSATGTLALFEGSRLRLRLPSEELATFINLSGREFLLGNERIRVGYPRVDPLVPAASLGSRMVTFRGATEWKAFEVTVRKHLIEKEIAGNPIAVPATRAQWAGQPMRRILTIKEKRVIGFALRIHGLTAHESIRLQEEGLGGRARMGCGLFTPM